LLKPGKNRDLERFAKRFSTIARSQWRVDDVVVFAALENRAGTRKERHLVSRAIHHRSITPKDLLGAVAVMGIKIDNRRAFSTIASLRMTNRNSCIVEKAKAHGSAGFRVMTGRADCSERVFRLSGHHLIYGKDCTTRSAQRCLETPSG
jgi:hypothetical protein